MVPNIWKLVTNIQSEERLVTGGELCSRHSACAPSTLLAPYCTACVSVFVCILYLFVFVCVSVSFGAWPDLHQHVLHSSAFRLPCYVFCTCMLSWVINFVPSLQCFSNVSATPHYLTVLLQCLDLVLLPPQCDTCQHLAVLASN